MLGHPTYPLSESPQFYQCIHMCPRNYNTSLPNERPRSKLALNKAQSPEQYLPREGNPQVGSLGHGTVPGIQPHVPSDSESGPQITQIITTTYKPLGLA